MDYFAAASGFVVKQFSFRSLALLVVFHGMYEAGVVYKIV